MFFGRICDQLQGTIHILYGTTSGPVYASNPLGSEGRVVMNR